MFADRFHGCCGFMRCAADEVVVYRDEEHGGQEAADEHFDQAEEERTPTDETEPGSSNS